MFYVLTRLEEAPFLYFLWTLLFSLLQFSPSTYGQSQNSYSVNPQYEVVSQSQHMPLVNSGTRQRGSANQNSVPASQGMQKGKQYDVGLSLAPVRFLNILNFLIVENFQINNVL